MKYSNPLDEDPLLKELLKQLDRIETRRGFAKWKAQFLEQFEMHLEGTNVTKAGQKYHAFAKRLDRLALMLKHLEVLMTEGECSVEHCTVKARQSLAELQKSLMAIILHTEALMPGTLEMEKEAGYSKFDMGAVLVRDGFVEYDRLCICNEILLHMRDIALNDVADRQLLEEMDRYWNRVQSLYQIMGTDLGLHCAIIRCRQILRAEDADFFEIERGNKKNNIVTRSSSSISTNDEDWENLNEKQSDQRFAKVEICGMELPLRFQQEQEDEDFYQDYCSSDFSSDISDYESWCWELELPDHRPRNEAVAKTQTPIPSPPQQQPPSPRHLPPPPQRSPPQQQQPPPPLLPKQPSQTLRPRSSPKSPPKTIQRKTKKEEDSSHRDDDDNNNNNNDDDDDDDNKEHEKYRYKWSGRDYYHGNDDDWRLASKLKKKVSDNESDE